MQRVGFLVGWMAQGPQIKTQTRLLERYQFLCDEGLRQARPTFYNNGESERMGS